MDGPASTTGCLLYAKPCAKWNVGARERKELRGVAPGSPV